MEQPDAMVAGVCGTPAGTISSYPGTFDGDNTGTGADFTVAEGACATENQYFDPVGEDQVVQLENLVEGQLYVVSVDSATADLSFYVATECDAAGPITDACLLFNDATVAGTAELNAFVAPAGGRAAVIIDAYDAAELGAYTLTVSEGECLDLFDCTAAATPVCNTFVCEAGPNTCTGDDAADTTGGGDDGPAGAQQVTMPTQAFTGAVCNDSGESDWFAVTVAQGEGVDLQLEFDNAADLDIAVVDPQNRLHGLAYWQNPETVSLTYLPAGTYYFVVTVFSPSGVAAEPYTATFTKTAAQTCTTSADCAAEYSTQVYRGNCSAGACEFIPSGALADGEPCDSSDDCLNGFCTYLTFEADAQDSVCSTSCTTSADCIAVGVGLSCTTGFGTNFCLPSCANDLECGVLDPTAVNDPGEAWNYLTCTVGLGSCGPDPALTAPQLTPRSVTVRHAPRPDRVRDAGAGKRRVRR
jgi:hypothetical protein